MLESCDYCANGVHIEECDDCDDEELFECQWCHEEMECSELHMERDLGLLCDQCIAAIRSRGEELVFEDEEDE